MESANSLPFMKAFYSLSSFNYDFRMWSMFFKNIFILFQRKILINIKYYAIKDDISCTLGTIIGRTN